MMALLLSMIFCNTGLAAEDNVSDGSTAQNAIKVVYGPDSNGPSHFWPDSALENVFLAYWKARLSWDWEAGQKNGSSLFSGNDFGEKIQGLPDRGEKKPD